MLATRQQRRQVGFVNFCLFIKIQRKTTVDKDNVFNKYTDFSYEKEDPKISIKSQFGIYLAKKIDDLEERALGDEKRIEDLEKAESSKVILVDWE